MTVFLGCERGSGKPNLRYFIVQDFLLLLGRTMIYFLRRNRML